MLPTQPIQVFRDVWQCRLIVYGGVAFDSRWLAVRMHSAATAWWLADLVRLAYSNDCLPPAPGHGHVRTASWEWAGGLNDDCALNLGSRHARAEWCTGPRRGGSWFCLVHDDACEYNPVFHTADVHIEPKSGLAARWLCELVTSVLQAGLRVPPPPRQPDNLYHRERPARRHLDQIC